jgi:pimeloyl-ACP methyl ester carboxylesterase
VVDPELGGLTFGAVTKHLKGLIMTPQRFHYVFANTVSRSVSDDAFEQFVVPESRNVPRSTLGRSARIDFAAPHAPLLFLTGDQDHLTPVAMVRRNAHKYVAGSGQADYQEFAGRSHYICAEPGWEEVADAALAWLSNQD